MNVVVKKSKIEGKGVFAARNFRKGEIVSKWDISHQLTLNEAKMVPEAEKKYISFTDEKIILQQPPERYTNHSCDPNTRVEKFCDAAIRDIKKGEEITTDYSADLIPGEKMKCNCGSKNCKRIITRQK